ncbi:MAG: hypothetical protein AVDCRST_MAG68-2928 [uncultured Gemmatimonadetes bacterium]|uniref:DUF3006 domain-containing protein n=1 Tax=uncultured Gemmatimonadota bacterium TaxID=203437 RepID=A0A6J4LPL8_9BACT|nr:MAG: hypothetical protein AVDCRST_MAG68-2928 [uncultured Gemmatimonadota bacterium]
MNRTWTVDSIEEGIASVQDEEGRMTHVPAWLLPDGTREGDVVAVDRKESRGSVTLRLRIDRAATRAALDSSRQQLARLKGGDGGGDIEL